MKKIIPVLVAGLLLLPGLLVAQPSPLPWQLGVQPSNAPAASHAQLIRFDLDFPGGTPEALVKAIEQGSGHPLNAIIAPEYANEPMPPLRMKSVNVAELFQALDVASQKTVTHITGTYFGGPGGQPSHQYVQAVTSSGFRCQGEVRDDSIWVFYKNVPPPSPDAEEAPEKICRFYQLGPYLEHYKVEDITTAIETGWKMLGDSSSAPPELSFHKDTKLLIAVGPPDKLKLIDSVLEQLRVTAPPVASPNPLLEPPPVKSGESAK